MRGKNSDEGITLDAHQKDIVRKISDYFSGIHTLQGSFLQTGSDNRRMKGKFYLSRPGRFRFDYARPSRQIVISDGQYLAVEDLDLNTEALANERPAQAISERTSLRSMFPLHCGLATMALKERRHRECGSARLRVKKGIRRLNS